MADTTSTHTVLSKLLTVTALAFAPLLQSSPPAAERLVWSDEFNGPSTTPSAGNWAYQTGGNGWGNHELEYYCAPTSTAGPCDPAHPNAFVSGGFLHIAARRNDAGEWTSARLRTRGLQAFQYGRFEARIRVPAGAGLWPAFWMLGADDDTQHWPACGELDIMEITGKHPAMLYGSIHGTGFTGAALSTHMTLPGDEPFSAAFHTFGMTWSPGHIQLSLDGHPYATYTPSDLPPGAIWPFDRGPFYFLLNLAVGGDLPGPPDAKTSAVSEMLVDYVRVYRTTPTSK